MNRRIARQSVYVALALALPCGGISGSAAQAQERPVSPVQHIDHIMIRTDRPAELYSLFIDVLRLPIAWPLADRGGVTSGAASFGNVNIEAITFPNQTSTLAGTHLVGFGFKPIPLAEGLAELTRRGIMYGEPRPFVSTAPNGVRMTFFTNVTLRQFSDSNRPTDATIHIFLSEYNPAYVDVDRRRARLRNELKSKGGGPLGVTGVKEVIIGTANLTTARRLWRSLLEPMPLSAPDRWQIGDGPAIRLVQAEANLLQEIVLAVVSLPRAIEFLKQAELLGSASETGATLAPAKVQGLQIRLVEDNEIGA